MAYHRTLSPLESVAISRKDTNFLGSFRRVRITRGALRQANIRESKGPSLGKIQVKLPHQRGPYAVTFEDRSQEETERQERDLANNIFNLKETEKATFYSPSEEWVLPAASTIEPARCQQKKRQQCMSKN